MLSGYVLVWQEFRFLVLAFQFLGLFTHWGWLYRLQQIRCVTLNSTTVGVPGRLLFSPKNLALTQYTSNRGLVIRSGALRKTYKNASILIDLFQNDLSTFFNVEIGLGLVHFPKIYHYFIVLEVVTVTVLYPNMHEGSVK